LWPRRHVSASLERAGCGVGACGEVGGRVWTRLNAVCREVRFCKVQKRLQKTPRVVPKSEAIKSKNCCPAKNERSRYIGDRVNIGTPYLTTWLRLKPHSTKKGRRQNLTMMDGRMARGGIG